MELEATIIMKERMGSGFKFDCFTKSIIKEKFIVITIANDKGDNSVINQVQDGTEVDILLLDGRHSIEFTGIR